MQPAGPSLDTPRPLRGLAGAQFISLNEQTMPVITYTKGQRSWLKTIIT